MQRLDACDLNKFGQPGREASLNYPVVEIDIEQFLAGLTDDLPAMGQEEHTLMLARDLCRDDSLAGAGRHHHDDPALSSGNRALERGDNLDLIRAQLRAKVGTHAGTFDRAPLGPLRLRSS